MNEECFKCLDEHEDLGLETRILVHHSGKSYVTQIDLKQGYRSTVKSISTQKQENNQSPSHTVHNSSIEEDCDTADGTVAAVGDPGFKYTGTLQLKSRVGGTFFQPATQHRWVVESKAN